MIRGALVENEFYGGQAVEVLNKHNGREFWRPAKIDRRTSRGCEVIYADGADRRPQHVMFSDIRPMEKTPRATEKVTTKLLSEADIDAWNAKEEARLKAEKEAAEAEAKNKPQQQTLVLVRNSGSKLGVPLQQQKSTPATPLGLYLRNQRLQRGLTQQDVGERLGGSQVLVSNLERGEFPPTEDQIMAYAEKLGFNLDEMIELNEQNGGGARPTPTLGGTERKRRTPKPHAATPLSQYLRNARIVAGMQQGYVAELSRVPGTRLCKLEFGDAEPTDEELEALARTLDLNVEHLYRLRGQDVIETTAEEASRTINVAPAPPIARAPEPTEPIVATPQVRQPPLPLPPERRRADDDGDEVRILRRRLAQMERDNRVLRRTVVFFAAQERA
jgi:transcriptional regulator with XRE-family HTH domain